MLSTPSHDHAVSVNRPRNLIIKDATEPFTFTYLQYGKPVSIVVKQTADEDTWPGGSLWDIGVLLAHVFVQITTSPNANPKSSVAAITLPPRLRDSIPFRKDASVLELGCGVGLSGLVAAATMGTRMTILTDLDVVVDKITRPNVLDNTIPCTAKTKFGGDGRLQPARITKVGNRGRIAAMPLCWGNTDDEDTVADTLRAWARPPSATLRKTKQKGKKNDANELPVNEAHHPDYIIIGDVAYQHKPGAPSHFDVLVSTMRRFIGPQTIVLFGTRMRMPASVDLLLMFEHDLRLRPLFDPPVAADEIDPASFLNMKHQITIHGFKLSSDAIESETKCNAKA